MSHQAILPSIPYIELLPNGEPSTLSNKCILKAILSDRSYNGINFKNSHENLEYVNESINTLELVPGGF